MWGVSLLVLCCGALPSRGRIRSEIRRIARIGTRLAWILDLAWETIKAALYNLSSRKTFKIGCTLKQPLLERRCFIHISDFRLVELRSRPLPLALLKDQLISVPAIPGHYAYGTS
jgi:hypothetical protein